MAKKLRVKCACGEVANVTPGTQCGRCRRPIDIHEDGMITLYRKGSPIGIAGGFGLYIDGEPMGHIGNKETLHIPLKYGTHTLHIATGLNRKCNDYTFTLTPEVRRVFAKVWMRSGFWTNSFVIEVATPDEMPEL